MSESVPPDDDDQLHASATRLINRADALLTRGARSYSSRRKTPPPPPPPPPPTPAAEPQVELPPEPPQTEAPRSAQPSSGAPTSSLFNAVRPTTMRFGIPTVPLENFQPNMQRPVIQVPQQTTPDPQAGVPEVAQGIPEAPPAPQPEDAASPAADDAPPPPPRRPVSELALAEHLLSIEADLTRALEQWLASELPELLQQEFAVFASELHTRLSAHARATLTTVLSESIAEGLSKAAAESEEEPPTE